MCTAKHSIHSCKCVFCRLGCSILCASIRSGWLTVFRSAVTLLISCIAFLSREREYWDDYDCEIVYFFPLSRSRILLSLCDELTFYYHEYSSASLLCLKSFLSANTHIISIRLFSLIYFQSIYVFIFVLEAGSHYVAQLSQKLLSSSDPPTSASQVPGTTNSLCLR